MKSMVKEAMVRKNQVRACVRACGRAWLLLLLLLLLDWLGLLCLLGGGQHWWIYFFIIYPVVDPVNHLLTLFHPNQKPSSHMND